MPKMMKCGGKIVPTRSKRPTWGPGEVEVWVDLVDGERVVGLCVEERDFATVHLTYKEARELARLLRMVSRRIRP